VDQPERRGGARPRVASAEPEALPDRARERIVEGGRVVEHAPAEIAAREPLRERSRPPRLDPDGLAGRRVIERQ
jgi:hypothetical protein